MPVTPNEKGEPSYTKVLLFLLDIEVSYLLQPEWPVGDTEIGRIEVNDRNDVQEFIEVFNFPVLLSVVIKAGLAHKLYKSFILDDGWS